MTYKSEILEQLNTVSNRMKLGAHFSVSDNAIRACIMRNARILYNINYVHKIAEILNLPQEELFETEETESHVKA